MKMDHRTRLHKILDILETRLQTLIEGSTARFLHLGSDKMNLSLQLVNAMETSIQRDDYSLSIAPNLFTLYVHPLAASSFIENQSLLDELAELIFHSGTEAGLTFYTHPTIRIKTDPDLDQNEINVIPEIKTGHLSETTTIAVNIGDTEDITSRNAFLLVGGDRVYSLTEPVINIGRRVDNHLVIDDNRVSRLHAQLRIINNKFVIFDLDSTSGTFVNDNLIQQHTLETGDVISLAGVPLVFGQEEATSPEKTEDSNKLAQDSTQPLQLVPEDENSND
jgi:pSer/pThr/pTyr-binding forkhead associated (FHA) protein